MDEEKNEILCRLISELANGNADALGEIYKILGKNLFLVANRYFNNKHDVEDAVQSFCCNLYKKSKKFKHSKNAYAWLICVFKNEVKNKLKQNRRELTILDKIDYSASETSPDYLDNYVFIHDILNSLDTFERKIVEMRFIEGHNLDYVAKKLHKSESTIRYYIDKIRTKIKNYE